MTGWEDQPALEEASDAVGTRAGHHGGDEEIEMTAWFWSDYLGIDIEPHETREMMMLLKIARSKTGEPSLEHHADIAGYAELASRASPYREQDDGR